MIFKWAWWMKQAECGTSTAEAQLSEYQLSQHVGQTKELFRLGSHKTIQKLNTITPSVPKESTLKSSGALAIWTIQSYWTLVSTCLVHWYSTVHSTRFFIELSKKVTNTSAESEKLWCKRHILWCLHQSFMLYIITSMQPKLLAMHIYW